MKSICIVFLYSLLVFSSSQDTLPETRCLPSAEGFAECKISSTRQRYNLPSAYQKPLGKNSTLGKDWLCRVPRGQHSAHSLTCAPHTPAAPVTRHGRYCLPSARKGTLGKHLFAECHEAGTRQRLSRAPHATVTPLPRMLHRCEDRYHYRLPSARLGHSAKIC